MNTVYMLQLNTLLVVACLCVVCRMMDNAFKDVNHSSYVVDVATATTSASASASFSFAGPLQTSDE